MSEEAVWGWACLSGIALAIVGSVVGISAWIMVPVHLVVLMTLFWWSDRCADRDATPAPPSPETAPPAPEPVRDEPPWMTHGWHDDFEDLLGEDGRW